MEPERLAARLTDMPRRLAVVAAAFIFASIGLPLGAQTNPDPANPGPTNPGPANPDPPTRMEAEAGLAGFVDGFTPMDVDVTVSTDVLFAGLLEAKLGAVTQVLPIEVPAGGSKVYNLRLGLPVGNPQVRLRLLSEASEDPAATLNLSLKVATDQLIVAVVGPDELVKTIDESISAVTERDVVGVGISADQLGQELDPARYLVLADPTELPAASVSWLSRGGRLVVDTADLGALGVDLPTGTGSFPFGSGWVIALDGVAQLGDEQWTHVFSPVPYRFAARETWQSPEIQLMQSAISGGDQRVPSLPWLLGALLGYAVLVGPVNFAILKKIGRRELAWATVPVLAFAGVFGFWTAGRQRLQEHVVSHASVVVANEAGVEGRTASVLVVGNEGNRTFNTADGWDTVPTEATADFNMPATAAVYARVDPAGGYSFELGDLGAAGLSSRWQGSVADIPQVDAKADGNQLEVEVSNTTDFSFWSWGVVARGRVVVEDDPLEPGGSGSRSLLPGQNGFNEFGTVGDAVINQLQLWEDPFIWNRLGPLSQVAATLTTGHDSYFFGFTEELAVRLVVDGDQVEATGTSLIVVPIDLTELMAAESSALSSQLLDAEDASFIDFGPGYVYVQGRSAMMGWEVPAGTANPTLVVNQNFGEVPALLDMYDWEGRTFVEVADEDVIDLSRFRNDRGEVVLRVGNDEDVFVESGFSPYSFALEIVS